LLNNLTHPIILKLNRLQQELNILVIHLLAIVELQKSRKVLE